jgi:hypothetical protein
MSKGSPLLLGVVGVSLWLGYQHATAGGDGTDVTIQVSPSALVLPAGNQCITVSTNIPYPLVDPGSLKLNGTLRPYLTKPNDRGCLMAKFRANDVKSLVSPPRAEICLTGSLVTGEPFEAWDTIVVKERTKRRK